MKLKKLQNPFKRPFLLQRQDWHLAILYRHEVQEETGFNV